MSIIEIAPTLETLERIKENCKKFKETPKNQKKKLQVTDFTKFYNRL